jgi:hypothetical protein
MSQPPQQELVSLSSSNNIVWRVNNKTFRNAQEIISYIEGLTAES